MRSARAEVISLAEVSAKGPAIPRYAQHAPRSIVYTSGTTGRPRGVVTTRTAKAASSASSASSASAVSAPPSAQEPRAERRPPSSLPTVRNLLGAPLNHAAGQASARATHAVGGCVYIMPRFDPEEALRIISREQITTTFLVPTMLNRIVNLPAETLAKHDVSSVKMIATGASPCPQSVKEQVIAYFGPHSLYESYGSTEVGLITRMLPDDHLKKPGSCGRLLDDVVVRVVDGEGREVPPGGIGEILVRTPVMIEHYLNRGTPEELVGGFFATGDVGRFDEDGYLYILDRKKDMIIAGGVNIYPAEIEDALRRHPAVLDAAVFGIPHADLGEEVRAVVERVEGQYVSEDELLAFVADKLAAYKRPRTIQLTSEIPRNAAGKVLKAELRAPYWQGKDKLV
jgi:long-chain acyl-CoA synthetase